MSYKTKLFPWCIIRPQTDMKQTIVARFRRRSEAESHLEILHQLLPTTHYTIIFDATLDSQDEDNEGVKS
jgi:hypothetical protein